MQLILLVFPKPFCWVQLCATVRATELEHLTPESGRQTHAWSIPVQPQRACARSWGPQRRSSQEGFPEEGTSKQGLVIDGRRREEGQDQYILKMPELHLVLRSGDRSRVCPNVWSPALGNSAAPDCLLWVSGWG